MGLLPRALAEAGVVREEISSIAFTHTHLDHVGGLLMADGSETFPNLKDIFVPALEIPLFERKGRLSAFHQRCTGFNNGHSISRGITSVEASGHEVGHTAFEIVGGGEKLLIWGDVVHVPSLQFARPNLTWEFDADQDMARSTREQLLSRVAKPDVSVAGAHLDFPGIGRVSRFGDGYRFAPI